VRGQETRAEPVWETCGQKLCGVGRPAQNQVRGQETRAEQEQVLCVLWPVSDRATAFDRDGLRALAGADADAETCGQHEVRGRETRAQQVNEVRGRETRAQLDPRTTRPAHN
jgi:hypothetical protein